MKIKAVTPIEHDGKRYEPGATFELAEDAALPLIQVKAAEAVEAPQAEDKKLKQK